MTAIVQTSGQSNSAADKSAALQEAEDFGRREGAGAAARASFYVTLTEFARDKRADVTDAETFWDRFDKGASAGASMIGGMKEIADDVRDVRVSECRTFLKMGGLTMVDGVEVLDRAMAIIKRAKLEKRLKIKATDAMLNVARAQCHANHNSNPLEDETIEIVIQPKAGAEKVEADALEPLWVQLERVISKFGESDEVLEAINSIQKRISDLGGTTRSQKAAAAAAKKQAKATRAGNSQAGV